MILVLYLGRYFLSSLVDSEAATPAAGLQEQKKGSAPSKAALREPGDELGVRDPLSPPLASRDEAEQTQHIRSAPLLAKLVDAQTGEPIPEFLIQIRNPRTPSSEERVVTDHGGRFQSSGDLETGRLELLLADDPSQPRRIEYEHSFDDHPRTEKVIQVPIGPTYRLDLELPAGVSAEDLHATFLRPASSGLREFHRAFAEDPESPAALFYGPILTSEGLEPKARLRTGELPWVRFGYSPIWQAGLGQASAYELSVRSEDGLWSGSAFVTSVVGVYPEAVPIQLVRQGAISGLVSNLDGRPVPTAWIRLCAPGAGPSLREVGADRKGRFSFQGLPPGDYRVQIESDRYQDWIATVRVAPGSSTDLKATVTGKGMLGKVAGVLRSRTGHHRSKGVIVGLKSLTDPNLFLVKTVGYRKREGEYVAPFSFDEVPLDEYELTIKPLDNMLWSRRRMIVSVPAVGIEFICEDDVATYELDFRAIDAKTNQPIEPIWTIVWQGDPLDDVRLDDDWETGLYKGVPEGASLRWILRAEGYRLAMGDESSLRSEGDLRVGEASLRQGWGQVFKVTTRDRVPLRDVELIADGESMGRTDSQGMVLMQLDSRPNSLGFRLDGWHVSWGSIDPAQEDFGWGPETPVYLTPDE